MKYKFTCLLLLNLFISTFVFSQAFTEDFESVYPRSTHPFMSFGNNGAEMFERNNKKYQLNWYLNTDSLITNSFTINGSKSLIFPCAVSSFGARSSVVFNNIDLRNLNNPVFRFKSFTGGSNAIVKVALRKRNQWQYISEPFSLKQDWFDVYHVVNSVYLLEHISSIDLDSVDIMIEGVSDNNGDIIIDDVSLSQANGNMQFSSINVNSTYGNTINTEFDANALEVLINTTGELNPLGVSQFTFTTDNSNNLQGIDSARLFYTSKKGKQYIDFIYPFGNVVIKPNGTFIINDNQLLSKNSEQHTFILKLYFNKNAVVGSIVNFKCTSVKVGLQTYNTSGSYNSKTLAEIEPILNHASKSVTLSNNYRGLSTANNSKQRSVFVYDVSDFGSTASKYYNKKITGIQIKLASKPSVPITGQLKVYMKVGDLGTVTGQWATEVAKLTMVYDGQFTIPAETGFFTITFNKPNLPINNSGMYELAYEWVVSSGTSTNLNYETFSSSNSAFSSGNTTSLPTTLTSTTFRPLLRFVFTNTSDILPIALPNVPRYNNINVNNQYALNYVMYSDKSVADSFNFEIYKRGVNSPTYTTISKLVKIPANSLVTVNMGNYNFNLVGNDTIYSSNFYFKNDLYVVNNIHTTFAFPLTSPILKNFDYEIFGNRSQLSFANNQMFLNKYQVAKRNYINSILIHVGKNSSAVNLIIRPVILDSSNNIIYTGNNYTITEKDINTFTILPINSFELNTGYYKIGIQYVQGDINQPLLSYDNSININGDWSYSMAINGQVNKLSSNIGLIIGFNSSSQSKALPELGLDRTVCDGYVLGSGVNANKYWWNTGDTSSSIVVDSSGKYIVRIQHANSNNFYYDSVYLTVIKNVKPIAKFDTVNSYTYCQNDSIQLSLLLNKHTANVKYKWYKNNTFIAETLSPDLDITNASNQDKYHVLLNYKLDCITDTLSFSDTIEIKIIPRLIDSVTILNTIDTICTDSIQLMVNSFDTNQLNYYTWMINGLVIDSTFTNSYTYRNIENNDTLVVFRNYTVGCFNSASVNSDTLIIKTKELFNFFEYTIDSTNKTFNFQSSSTNYNKLIWDFGDGSIDTNNNTLVSHQYLVDGTYKVSLIAQNDCSIDTFSNSIDVYFTGINNENNIGINIYPNPTKGQVFINNSKENFVRVYDVYGKYLGQKCIDNHSISLSEYNDGVYFLQFDNKIFRVIKLM